MEVDRGMLALGHMRAYLDEKIREYRRELGILGPCTICSREAVLCQDHDHVNGLNRGKLCARCNNGLGSFKDDPERLRAAKEYIHKWRAAHSCLKKQQKKEMRYRTWQKKKPPQNPPQSGH